MRSSTSIPSDAAQRSLSTIRLGLICTRYELKQFFRQWESMVFGFLFPILMLVIFGALFGEQWDQGISVRQYFTAGMMSVGVMMSSFQTLAIWLAEEREDGTLKRLHGTPLPPVAFFLGKIGQVLVISMVQAIIQLLTARLFFQVPLPATAELWLRLGWIYVLGVAAGTVLGIAASSLARSGRSAPSIITPIALVLQFMSGVYFVFTRAPGWVQTVGALFPLKWLAQGIRSALLPSSAQVLEPAGTWELGRIALVLGAWLIGGLVLCTHKFRWLRPSDR